MAGVRPQSEGSESGQARYSGPIFTPRRHIHRGDAAMLPWRGSPRRQNKKVRWVRVGTGSESGQGPSRDRAEPIFTSSAGPIFPQGKADLHVVCRPDIHTGQTRCSRVCRPDIYTGQSRSSRRLQDRYSQRRRAVSVWICREYRDRAGPIFTPGLAVTFIVEMLPCSSVHCGEAPRGDKTRRFAVAR
jgi:hypothetical protein